MHRAEPRISRANPLADDKLHEECGVFGIFGHADAAALTTLGLHALQHRGQEAAGIVSFDGSQFFAERHRRPDRRHLHQPSVHRPAARARGPSATPATPRPAATSMRNVQPLFAEFAGGGFAVAHNGNITNAMTLQPHPAAPRLDLPLDLRHRVILHLIATSKQADFEDTLHRRVVGRSKARSRSSASPTRR